MNRRLERRAHMRGLVWQYILTDFVEANAKNWLRHPALKPLFSTGRIDCCVFDSRQPYAPLRLLHSGKVLEQGTLANPPVLISNYTFCVIEMDAFQVARQQQLYVVCDRRAWHDSPAMPNADDCATDTKP